MPTRNVNLTNHFDTFVEDGVHSGRFSNASEVVREGLRLLEQRDAEDRAKIEWLRSTTHEAFAALDRGEGISLSSREDIDAFVNSAMDELHTMRNHEHG